MARPQNTERPSEAEKAARVVGCPTCLSYPGSACQTRFGRRLSYSHITRVAAAEEYGDRGKA